MNVLNHKCTRYRFLVTTCVLGFLVFLSTNWHWIFGSILYSEENGLLEDDINYLYEISDSKKEISSLMKEYENRVEHVRQVCNRRELSKIQRTTRMATNRQHGVNYTCGTDKCTVIVDENKLFYCTIPKVASTQVKKFLLNISNIPLSDAIAKDDDAMHVMANDALTRVSPTFFTPLNLQRFYKIMFVRHPFDRLVSAFRSKAEQPGDRNQYYYSKFWDPIMRRLRPKGAVIDRITFREFIWSVVNTREKQYDVHWATFWRRCDPCFVGYDFIGKLETASVDFVYAFRKADLEFDPKWWDSYLSTNRSVTLKYFATLSEEYVRKLYDIYRYDFELFGYSVDEFLPRR